MLDKDGNVVKKIDLGSLEINARYFESGGRITLTFGLGGENAGVISIAVVGTIRDLFKNIQGTPLEKIANNQASLFFTGNGFMLSIINCIYSRCCRSYCCKGGIYTSTSNCCRKYICSPCKQPTNSSSRLSSKHSRIYWSIWNS